MKKEIPRTWQRCHDSGTEEITLNALVDLEWAHVIVCFGRNIVFPSFPDFCFCDCTSVCMYYVMKMECCFFPGECIMWWILSTSEKYWKLLLCVLFVQCCNLVHLLIWTTICHMASGICIWNFQELWSHCEIIGPEIPKWMYFSPPKQCHSCPQVVSGIAAQFFGADLQSQAHPRQEGCPFKARLTHVNVASMWDFSLCL